MSDALDYLLKARPEAMGHYFAFLKDAGRHLDPKTRALISVITKVHAQTESGLRQYLRRALRAGARPEEVLDAMLMAFPALGLTRIVWAVDVILRMDLPGFRLEALAGSGEWHLLGPADAYAPGETVHVECDGRGVFVHRGGEGFVVMDARCPHQGYALDAQALRDGEIACPRHGRVFEAASGACVRTGEEPLARLPSRVREGTLEARW